MVVTSGDDGSQSWVAAGSRREQEVRDGGCEYDEKCGTLVSYRQVLEMLKKCKVCKRQRGVSESITTGTKVIILVIFYKIEVRDSFRLDKAQVRTQK